VFVVLLLTGMLVWLEVSVWSSGSSSDAPPAVVVPGGPTAAPTAAPVVPGAPGGSAPGAPATRISAGENAALVAAGMVTIAVGAALWHHRSSRAKKKGGDVDDVGAMDVKKKVAGEWLKGSSTELTELAYHLRRWDSLARNGGKGETAEGSRFRQLLMRAIGDVVLDADKAIGGGSVTRDAAEQLAAAVAEHARELIAKEPFTAAEKASLATHLEETKKTWSDTFIIRKGDGHEW
jgi:hypothetical protein